MDDSPDVVLLRSPDEEPPDRYVAALDRAGMRARCEPVLAFTFPRQTELRDRLSSPDRYAGLIATSPRTGTALSRVFDAHESLADAWQGRPVYTVGPKTADRLRDLGLRPRGMEAGTAEALAGTIIDEAPDAPLLFLCGNRRRDTLPEALRAAEVAFEELVVYETHLRTDLALPPPDGTTWLVFFSPSGVEALLANHEGALEGYRIATIGPTTEGAVRAAGHSVEVVADEPSPEGLVRGLTDAGSGRS